VFRCNALALTAFLTVSTQWQGDGNGISYSNAAVAWKLAGLEITPDTFAKFQVLEVEAINAAREQHEPI